MKHRIKFFLGICLLAAFVSLPSHAVQKQYHCSGGYGDSQDSGLWDWTFIASSEKDAAMQAKKKYELNTPGAWVTVFHCKVM